MGKTVYSYSPVTGEYAGITVADESPLEPGVYLLPAHSTETPPPLMAEYEKAVWDGAEWSLVPDWRGAVRYRTDTGEAVHITELGPLPGGVTDVPPPDGEHVWEGGDWILPLEVARGRKLAEISAAHLAHVAGSVQVSLGFPMQFDTRDSLMVRGAIELLEASGGTTGYLTDANNMNHVVTLDEMKTALTEMMMAFSGAHLHKQNLRSEANSATTQAELDAIDLSFDDTREA